MSSKILNQLKADLISARKDHDEDSANILRIALSAVRNAEIEKGESLSEDEITELLYKEIKKVQDSIESFTKAGKPEMAEIEKKQKAVLEKYVPALMSESEIGDVVESTIKSMGDVTMRDFGRVMQSVMKDLKGKADGSVVSAIVKKVLSEQ